jgi:hypothetical protein
MLQQIAADMNGLKVKVETLKPDMGRRSGVVWGHRSWRVRKP